jgi:hypothetical protein
LPHIDFAEADPISSISNAIVKKTMMSDSVTKGIRGLNNDVR